MLPLLRILQELIHGFFQDFLQGFFFLHEFFIGHFSSVQELQPKFLLRLLQNSHPKFLQEYLLKFLLGFFEVYFPGFTKIFIPRFPQELLPGLLQ